MNSSNTTGRVSGLKLPSKIKRPTSISLEKPSVPVGIADDGISSTVKRLNNDLIKTRINEDGGTIDIIPETPARKKNDSISSWDGIRKPGEDFTRRSSDASIVLTEDTDSFIVGDRVWVGGNKPGVIAFIGETQFGPGDWAGIVLDEPIGKNDGSVAGKRYFQCEPNRGIFSRLTRLSRTYMDVTTPVTPKSTSGTPTTTSTLNHGTSVASVNNSISSLKTPAGSHFTSTDLKLGDRVIVQSSQGSKPGILRYIGKTEFGAGIWCGVELDDPLGKNDGSIDGVRYFECAPKFGLFVPVEKVSRSPINNKKSPCSVHPSTISRQGTQDSIRSVSTIGTTASSIKSNARRPSRPSGIRSTPVAAPKSPLQIELKEKDEYIKQLLKEKEMERASLTRAASQADELEKKLKNLQEQYSRLFNEKEIQNETMMCAINKLEKDKISLIHQLDEERRKAEDLQFSFEEESLTKSEIQSLNEQYKAKLDKLEKTTVQKVGLESGGELEKAEVESQESKENIVDELNRKISRLQNEVDQYKFTKNSLEERLNAMEAKTTNLTGLLEEKNVALEETLRNNLNWQEKLQEAEREKFLLTNELNEYNSRLQRINENESTMKPVTRYLKRICSEVEDKNEKLNDTIIGKRVLDETFNELTGSRSAAVNTADEAEAETLPSDVTELLADLENKIDKLVTTNVMSLEKIETLSDVISRKDEDLAYVTKEKEELMKEYAELNCLKNADVKNLEERYSSLSKVKDELEHQLQTSRENIKKLETLFSSKDESSKLEIENMKSILNDKITDYQFLSTEFSDKINQLTNEIQKRDEETATSIAEQRKLIEQLNSELNETVPDLERTRREKEQLELDMMEYRQEKEVEVNNLKEICAQLTDKLHELESILRVGGRDSMNVSAFEDDSSVRSITLDDTSEFNANNNRASNETLNELIDKLNRQVELKEVECNRIRERCVKTVIDYLWKIPTLADDDSEKHTEVDEAGDNLLMVDENLKRAVTNCRDEFKKLKVDSDRIKSELLDKQSLISDYEKKVKLFDEKNSLVSSQLEDTESKYIHLKNTCEQSEKSKAELQSQLEQLRSSNSDLEMRCSRLSDEKTELDSQSRVSEENIAAKLSELKEVSSECQQLKNKLSESENRLQHFIEEKTLMEQTYKTEEESFRKKFDLNEMSCNELKKNLDDAHKKFELEKCQLVQNINNLERERRELIAAKESQINELTKKLNSQYEIFQEADRLHKESMENLQKQISQLQAKEEFSPKRKKVTDSVDAAKCFAPPFTDNFDKAKGDSNINGNSEGRNENRGNRNINSHPGNTDLNEELYKQVVDEKLQADSQISFLNSVIVDMQHKNQDLLDRIAYLESRIPAEIPKEKVKTRTVTPRLFCDICDVFDSHDTDDCPQKSNTLSSSLRKNNSDRAAVKHSERPYCDICEMFGHDTSQCDDNETF